jgi:hypothetical protein
MKKLILAFILSFASVAHASESEAGDMTGQDSTQDELVGVQPEQSDMGYVPTVSPVGLGVRLMRDTNSHVDFWGASLGVSPLIGQVTDGFPVRLRGELGRHWYLSGNPRQGLFFGTEANLAAWTAWLLDDGPTVMPGVSLVIGTSKQYKSGWGSLFGVGFTQKLYITQSGAPWSPGGQLTLMITPPKND